MSRRTVLLSFAVSAALALGACASDADSAAPAPDADAQASDAAEVAAGPLEGTWTTDLNRKAVRAYIRRAGWGKEAEKALLDPDMAGPDKTEFRVDFVGDRFRMAQVSTDEQWQSGTFTIDDGRIYLDDEAPVGELTFQFQLDGDTATFDDPSDTSGGGEFLPGVPGWAPGAVMWASTTWERSAS
jgi:hypothetical protein